MANHLNLRRVLLEFGQGGVLVIFSDGHSALLLSTEAILFSKWLNLPQTTQPLRTGNAQFELDSRGNLKVSNRYMELYIETKEVVLIRNWLSQRFSNLSDSKD